MKTCKEILNESQNHMTTCKNGTHTAYRVLMCSELDLTSTLASLRLALNHKLLKNKGKF